MIKSIIYYIRKGMYPKDIYKNLHEVYPERMKEENITIYDIEETFALLTQ